MDLPTIKKHAHAHLPVVLAGHAAEGGIDGAAYLRGGAVGDVLLKHEGDVFTGGPQPAEHAVVFEVARKFGDGSARVKRVRRHAVRCGAEQKKTIHEQS